MFNNLIGKNKELGRFLFCERYTLPPVKNAMYIAEGQELKRGAVVDVNGVLVGTNSLMPYAVLEFDCDTRSGGKEASVFIKGEFNFDKLHFASGLSKSDMDNIVYNGSGLGIVIKPYEYAEGFSPLMVPAGTSQSNPLMNAEETERMINAMKPIDDMTLRFEFYDKDFNPTTDLTDVIKGTWVKVDSPTLNIWDWTYDDPDWSYVFDYPDAFYEDGKEFAIIAAGDTSGVTTLAGFVEGCRSLKSIVLFDTSNVTNISWMFMDCDSLTSIPLFDTGNATDMSGMFLGCTSLKSIPLFNTSNATKMQSMVEKCTSLKSIPLLDTSNVTNIVSMFEGCTSLESIPLLDTSSVTDMGDYYENGMFKNCTSLKSIPLLDTSNVTNMSNMFIGCSSLTSVPLFDTGKVNEMSNMFKGCNKVEGGSLALYQQASSQATPPSSHWGCFENCGIDTETGTAELEQIPQSWGGLAEG